MSRDDIGTLHKWAKRWSHHRDTPLAERRLWRQIAAETGRYLDDGGEVDQVDGPPQSESLFDSD